MSTAMNEVAEPDSIVGRPDLIWSLSPPSKDAQMSLSTELINTPLGIGRKVCLGWSPMGVPYDILTLGSEGKTKIQRAGSPIWRTLCAIWSCLATMLSITKKATTVHQRSYSMTEQELKDMLAQLILDLKRDEGYRSHPYQDSVGKTTIGYGRNLEDNGIDQTEAEFLLRRDIGKAFEEARSTFPFIAKAPLEIQRGFYNMAFNMGLPRLAGFKKMLAALEAKDYKTAAAEALDSKWAEQVGVRAKRIAAMFELEAESGDQS